MEIHVQNHYEKWHADQLNERMREAFGFSFERWFGMGLWRDNYEIYSVIEDGRMLSCVGVYKQPLLISGQKVDALQIGAVTTRADCRARGYSRAIMERIFEVYPDTPAFLHANDTVTGFYPRFGFRRVIESVPTLEAAIDNHIERIVLHPCDEALANALDSRGAYSGALDAMHTQSVQIFNMLENDARTILSIPALDAVVIASQQHDKLLLHDAIAKSSFPFVELAKHLPFCGVRQIEFGFTPDWLSVSPAWSPITDDDSALFVRGNLPLPDHFRIPVTSVT